jgi:hypothetical protein
MSQRMSSLSEGALDWFHSAADKDFSYQLVQQLNRPECKFAEAMVTAYVQMLDWRSEQIGGILSARESSKAGRLSRPFSGWRTC